MKKMTKEEYLKWEASEEKRKRNRVAIEPNYLAEHEDMVAGQVGME